MISVCIKLICAFIFCLTVVSAQTVSAQKALLVEKSSPQTSNDHVVHEFANLRGLDATRTYGNIKAVATASLHDISEVPINQSGRTLVAGLDQLIVTVAGTGQPGYNADNIIATGANLAYPSGIKVDGNGDFYIADTSNHRVRKVTVINGEITTIAGTGKPGYNGDSIVATSAELSYPGDVALDGLGNVYIADTNNHRVRMYSTGIIYAVAGTGVPGYSGDRMLATSAQLNYPVGVAVDGAGNIYIADTQNSLVRKVTTITGKINTICGTDFFLAYPSGIALDGMGNIYVSDQGYNFVVKVTASTGMITVIAGTGSRGYNGDNIRATDAKLSYPQGVAVDGEGNVYIADLFNNRIRKVTVSTGIITTIAGTGAFLYNGDGILATSASVRAPYGVAVDGMGNVYIAETSNHRIRLIRVAPSASPSTAPSMTPTSSPSTAPSMTPTSSPSTAPSVAPTSSPSTAPSMAPTSSPSTATPTSSPSTAPSVAPTSSPSTATPTSSPSTAPSMTPTSSPNTATPTSSPSTAPSMTPTSSPSTAPSTTPTSSPSTAPSVMPKRTPKRAPHF